MVWTRIYLLVFALVLSLGPWGGVKAKKCKKPMGFPGDLAKCSEKGKWQRESTLKKIQETVEENGYKLDELLTTGGTEGECAMVVFGNYWLADQYPLNYNPDHVVTNEDDYFHIDNYNGKKASNYWLTDDGKTGEDAYIFFAFQCPRTIKGILLKNTHNYINNDRGTQHFTISISDKIDGQWTDILTATLPDARNVSPVPVLNFDLEKEVETQYLRFQVDTYYGTGGGLQYFSTY